MIARLEGVLIESTPTRVVLDVGGVGEPDVVEAEVLGLLGEVDHPGDRWVAEEECSNCIMRILGWGTGVGPAGSCSRRRRTLLAV